MGRTIYFCDQCGSQRSRRSKGLCLECYKANQRGLHPDCTHYWIVGVPKGSHSTSVCKLCGDRTKFANSIDAAIAQRPGTKPSSAVEMNEARKKYNRVDFNTKLTGG